MLLALAAFLLATALFLAGEGVTQPARERRRSVRRAAAPRRGARRCGFRLARPRRLVPRPAPAGGDPLAASRCPRPARRERRGGACLPRRGGAPLRGHGRGARRRASPPPRA